MDNNKIINAELDKPIEEQLKQLSNKYPLATSLWEQCQSNSLPLYEEENTNSLSVDGHPVAEKFKYFLGDISEITLLDIGCGTQALPHYLGAANLDLTFGVDPFLGQPKLFNFFQCLGETLPFCDKTFDLVIVATSFDHFIDPTLVTKQIERVLKPGGIFASWNYFVPDAQRYYPSQEKLEKADDFHVYHWNRSDFLELFQENFQLTSEMQLFRNGYSADTFCSFKRN